MLGNSGNSQEPNLNGNFTSLNGNIYTYKPNWNSKRHKFEW
jgi:hypothetical protein